MLWIIIIQFSPLNIMNNGFVYWNRCVPTYLCLLWKLLLRISESYIFHVRGQFSFNFTCPHIFLRRQLQSITWNMFAILSPSQTSQWPPKTVLQVLMRIASCYTCLRCQMIRHKQQHRTQEKQVTNVGESDKSSIWK